MDKVRVKPGRDFKVKRIICLCVIGLLLIMAGTVLADENLPTQESYSEGSVPIQLVDLLDARVMWADFSIDLTQMREQTQNPFISRKTQEFYYGWYRRYNLWSYQTHTKY